MSVLFGEVDRLYRYAGSVDIRYNVVDHDPFKRFARRLRSFLKALGEEPDSFWTDFVRPMRRYRRNLSWAPLPFNDPATQTTVDRAVVRRLLSVVDQVYPRLAPDASALWDDFLQLSSSAESPLMDGIERVLDRMGAAAAGLLIPDSRLLAAIRHAVHLRGKTRALDLLGVDALRDAKAYNRIILLGSARWYPDFVFSAPRASIIDVVSYRWQRERWRRQVRLIGVGTDTKDNEEDGTHHEEELIVDEDLPRIDWAEIERRAEETLGEDTRSHDEIEARLFALDGGYAMYLEAREGSTCLVIDSTADGRAIVRRVRTSSADAPMFVLLRTQGGGDYVIPVADRILGPKLDECRAAQAEWKARLRAAISDHGLSEVAHQLRVMGARHADEINVRYWISERAIGPLEKNDFGTVMLFVHLEDRLERYWSVIRTIRLAHVRAGFTIRRRLLERVQSVDSGQIRREGRLEFVLPEAEGGRLSALRLEGRAPTTTFVPASRLARLFERRD